MYLVESPQSMTDFFTSKEASCSCRLYMSTNLFLRSTMSHERNDTSLKEKRGKRISSHGQNGHVVECNVMQTKENTKA
jgi:hypothetical protein